MSQPTLDEFRAEASAFLDSHATLRKERSHRWGEGPDTIAVLPEKTHDEEVAEVANAKAWRAKVFDAGFGWITGPTELGGRGLPTSYQAAWAQLESRYETPSQEPFGIGLGMVAPTILAHAIDDVRKAYLPGMWRGDLIGCQLFSEPAAGSDLAGLQTRAERDGDEWVLNGQKVWTSNAQYADIGEIICRTDPDAPKHRGLTGFVVNMKAPGVEVRPLRQMTGGASFNEVFFTDVRVPDTHRLGDVNQGWTVALTTLMNERAAIGGGGGGVGGGIALLDRIIGVVSHVGDPNDALLRDELANVLIHMRVARLTGQRASAKIKAGQLPGPEMSIGKLALTQNLQRISALVSNVLGPRLCADSGEWGTYAWSQFVLGVPGMRVAGGTDEVMRNIVGERVLGLPKEPALATTTSS